MHLKPGILLKRDYLDLAKDVFQNTGVRIMSEGKRHLGASIGFQSFTTEYMNEKVESWTASLLTLSNIAKAHPHMAYCDYIPGLANKWTYFL